jgi:hypothetical protein
VTARPVSGDGIDVAEVGLALGLREVALGDLGRARDDPRGCHGDGPHGIRAARLEVGVDQVGLGLRLGLLPPGQGRRALLRRSGGTRLGRVIALHENLLSRGFRSVSSTHRGIDYQVAFIDDT